MATTARRCRRLHASRVPTVLSSIVPSPTHPTLSRLTPHYSPGISHLDTGHTARFWWTLNRLFSAIRSDRISQPSRKSCVTTDTRRSVSAATPDRFLRKSGWGSTAVSTRTAPSPGATARSPNGPPGPDFHRRYERRSFPVGSTPARCAIAGQRSSRTKRSLSSNASKEIASFSSSTIWTRTFHIALPRISGGVSFRMMSMMKYCELPGGLNGHQALRRQEVSS